MRAKLGGCPDAKWGRFRKKTLPLLQSSTGAAFLDFKTSARLCVGRDGKLVCDEAHHQQKPRTKWATPPPNKIDAISRPTPRFFGGVRRGEAVWETAESVHVPMDQRSLSQPSPAGPLRRSSQFAVFSKAIPRWRAVYRGNHQPENVHLGLVAGRGSELRPAPGSVRHPQDQRLSIKQRMGSRDFLCAAAF